MVNNHFIYKYEWPYGSTITKICKGKLHKLHGYTFMYGGD